MKQIKKILGKNIWLKISFFNSFRVLSRILSGWIINKVIAVYVGPEGTTLSEQFRNFLQTLQGISTMGIQEGVTKYTSKYQNNRKQLSSFLSSSYKLVLISSIFMSVLVVSFSKQINHLLFDQRDYQILIVLSGILIPLFSINILITSLLNGFQKYKKITYINTASNIFVAVLAIFLVKSWGLEGALILVLATQIIMFVFTLLFIKNDLLEILNLSLSNTKTSHYKRLYNYIIMALVSAIIIPVFSILIRNLIFNYYEGDSGLHAGYWDAVRKISTLFLSLVTPVFSLYYYPQLSKINTSLEFKKEFIKFFKQIFPLFTIGIILLYLLRYWAIIIFFSKEYLPMDELFLWQLLGDYTRVLSLTFAFLMLAKAQVRWYLITEIGFWVIYYFLSNYMLQKYELKGVTIAYFITYTIYFITLFALYGKYIFSKKEVIIK